MPRPRWRNLKTAHSLWKGIKCFRPHYAWEKFKNTTFTGDRAEKRLRMRHLRPSRETAGAKMSTWTAHSEWKTIESLDFTVKFKSVFRYETVVFRRYVLALVLVVLLRKFEAYLVYLSLIWGKFPRRFSCFQKFRHFSYMFPGFPARISDMRNRFSALSSPVSLALCLRQR